MVSGVAGKGALKMVDKWIVNNDPHLCRSDSIRRRAELESPPKAKAKKPLATRDDHAREPATIAMDEIIAPLAPQPVGLRLSKSAPTDRLISARAFASAQSSGRRRK